MYAMTDSLIIIVSC